MAITAYTGPPGSGKSYALISQIILPAILSGRRVVTNVDGLKPDLVEQWALDEGCGAPGSIVLFDAQAPLRDGFFPTQAQPTGCFVQPGDLLVFDEWRLTFSNRGAVGNPELEPFLRWHRHLVGQDGVACDVVIGTQLITDIHRDFRGLVERSYKFRKLSAVGLAKAYQFDCYEGPDQRKGTAYRKGNGRYSDKVFRLYKSFDTDGDAKELKTDKRSTFFSPLFLSLAAVAFVLVAGGAYATAQVFAPDTTFAVPQAGAAGASGVPTVSAGRTDYLPALPGEAGGSVPAVTSEFRIVGTVSTGRNTFVIVADDKGSTRSLPARDFIFEEDRPVSGLVDGKRVNAEDRIYLESGGSSPLGSVLLPGQQR